MAESSKESGELQELINEDLLNNRIDPSTVNKYIDEVLERPDMFLTRTLMSGSDIVEATLRQINNFTEDRLRLELE
jgi:predicted KAP-like P-loop ATPase